jgi:hypothetical protein
MKRTIAVALMLCAAAWSREKRLPAGEASNDTVKVAATCLDAEQLKETFGTDFDNMFSVIEVTLTPKGGKALDVHLDDFLARSEQTGAHGGALSASQIAGQDALVVHQDDVKKGKGGISWGGGFGGMGGGGGGGAPPPETRTEMKKSDKRDPLLDVLKRKILADKPVNEPVTGLLFFSLDKEKPKNLVLIYTTPAPQPTDENATAIPKLRIRFK